MPDIQFADHGSLVLLTPLTPAGAAWTDDNLADAMRFGGSVAVDRRYASDVLMGADDDGLTCEVL